MLSALKQLFASPDTASSGEDTEAQRRLISAALLLEVSKADYASDPEELAKIRELLISHFTVSETELDALLEEAGHAFDKANALHPFTRFINDNCDDAQKYQLIEHAWQVAWADGSISKYEEHLIRHLAELIYVPHSLFIRAKLKAEAKS